MRNHLLIALFTLVLGAQSAPAQILYGQLVGNVTDPSNAAVAGATVTITNRNTNQSRATTTNEAGGFTFATVQAGTWEVRVTREGFHTAATEANVTINSVTRADLQMQLGAVSETIEVTAAAAVLQTDRSEVRAEVSSQTLQNMPVAPGRNYQQVLRMLPGFRPPTNAHSVPTNPSRALTYNVNGVSQSINNVRIDGASSNSPWLPHITSFVPTLEAIDTVNVVTNSFDAEQGLAGGAAVNVQIRSGTNDLHGSAFEYHTNNHLKAKPWILPPGQRKPKLVNNEFGGTLGGPIKKDKLFYFMSYEGTPYREFASRLGTVPTPLQKQGNMSESTRPVYDPQTGNPDGTDRTPFPDNIIPANRISPIIRKLVALTPDPNLPGLTNNYFGTAGYLFDRHRADTKVNWSASSKLSMFARYSLLKYTMQNDQMFGEVGGPEISSAGGNPGTATGTTHSFTGAGTYILSPTLVMDAYYGYTLANTKVEQVRLDEKLGLDFLGIPGTNGARAFEGGWPRFIVSSYTDLGLPNAFMPYDRSDPQHQYVANANWTRGSHEIRFGTDIYFTGMNHLQPEVSGAGDYPEAGGFTFGTGPTSLPGGVVGNQFNSYATFLLGLPTALGKITQIPDRYSTRQRSYSLYIRDRWSATRRLTVSYGVRWEYYPFPTRSDRGLEWYNTETNKMHICGVGQVPKDCGVSVSNKLFAPRFGFAWRPTETFVIRAGYGLTYDPFSLQRPLRTNYPVLINQLFTADSFRWVSPIAQGIPAPVTPNLGNGIIDIPSSYTVITTGKDFKRGYVQSWNFTLQKQLWGGFTGQAGYVATRSTKQLGYLDINAGQVIGADNAGRPLLPKFGRATPTIIATPIGTSTYDSLQTTLERRFAHGFALNASYTWGKVMGFANNSDDEPSIKALQYFDRNRAPRSYDRTHNFQLANIWELPFGKGRKWATSGLAHAVASGWQFNSMLSLYSGTPFTVTSSGNSLRMPGSQQTADQVKANVETMGGTGRGASWFDPFAFASVPTTRGQERFGTSGLNTLRGPGLANLDLGIFRRFNINERWRVEFRAEAFNFTNTPHFANPGANVDNFDPNNADPTRRLNGYTEITGVTNLGRDGIDERQFRFGLRLAF